MLDTHKDPIMQLPKIVVFMLIFYTVVLGGKILFNKLRK